MPSTRSIDALLLAGGQWELFAGSVQDACRSLAKRPARLGDLVLSLRDMPYGRPSHAADPEAVLQEWRGTCSNKHLVLVHMLQRLGHRARLCMAKFEVVAARSGLPQPVLDRIGQPERPFWDVHNYVRADIAGPVVLDITWPAYLTHPYFTVPRDWDERTDLPLIAKVSDERTISADAAGLAAKRSWLDTLNVEPAQREQRERLIQALSHFVESEASYADREQSIHSTIGRRYT